MTYKDSYIHAAERERRFSPRVELDVRRASGRNSLDGAKVRTGGTRT